MSNEKQDYTNIDLAALQGNFRKMSEPVFTPSPEDLELDQIPTLQKMLTDLHFKMIEKEAELDVLKSQIIATNCAISAMQKVREKNK
jgi:hypothetical protein